MNVEIIGYHYVRGSFKGPLGKLKYLKTEDFELQLEWLERNYNILSLDEFIQKEDKSKINGKKNCLLTFDDGYLDHYVNVFPLLLDRNISGLFFPPVQIFKNKKLLDVNLIQLIVNNADINWVFHFIKTYYVSNIGSLNMFEKKIQSINTKSRFDDPQTILVKKLLQSELEETYRLELVQILYAIIFKEDESSLHSKFYLSEENLIEMIDQGMYVGSHTVNHVRLSSCSKEVQFSELSQSLEWLGKIHKTNQFHKTICFPYGGFNQDTIEICKYLGYEIGFTTNPGIYSSNDSLLEIPRFDTNNYPPVSIG